MNTATAKPAAPTAPTARACPPVPQPPPCVRTAETAFTSFEDQPRIAGEHAKRCEKLGISHAVESNAKCFFLSTRSRSAISSASTASGWSGHSTAPRVAADGLVIILGRSVSLA